MQWVDWFPFYFHCTTDQYVAQLVVFFLFLDACWAMMQQNTKKKRKKTHIEEFKGVGLQSLNTLRIIISVLLLSILCGDMKHKLAPRTGFQLLMLLNTKGICFLST